MLAQYAYKLSFQNTLLDLISQLCVKYRQFISFKTSIKIQQICQHFIYSNSSPINSFDKFYSFSLHSNESLIYQKNQSFIIKTSQENIIKSKFIISLQQNKKDNKKPAKMQLSIQNSQQQFQQLSKSNQIDLRAFIQPPNPITTKKISSQQNQNQIMKTKLLQSLRIKRNKYTQLNQQLSLTNFYGQEILIFQKYQNSKNNRRNGIKYSSSMLIANPSNFISNFKYVGMVQSDEFFIFDSNFQSANLFQVYKTGDRQYDLVLQNDINTTGYAQWFNFKVKNKAKNISIKLNIVNLYKSNSLYQKGMKPLCLSKYEDKKWNRNTYQVQYYQNSIPTQRDPNKNYNTLSFSYQFKYQNDEVQFSHFYPYTSMDCQNFLESINGSKKITIKSLGNSTFKKTIPIIQISSYQSKTNKPKKAIILIGRQHSGQTQSSFIIEEFVNILLTNDNETEFILQKFDVYVCPMLNIDGVYLGNFFYHFQVIISSSILGNYRTNAYGFDLNRYWHCQNPLKTPEIYYFKKFINNLKKRHQISLIIDLHGHSKKLNSFFYGNPYGKNYMMLPFIASKINQMVKFKSCTFHEQKSQKSTTARAILGNLLKDMGTYVYTYQVSFWGYKKNNRVIPYSLTDLKQLSKTLVSSIYKLFIEEIKEQNHLKQSVFFKEIKKQFNNLGDGYFDKESGSDSEAEQLVNNQEKQRIQYQSNPDNKVQKQKQSQYVIRFKEVGIQANLDFEDYNNRHSQVFINSSIDKVNVLPISDRLQIGGVEDRNTYVTPRNTYRQRKLKALFKNKLCQKKQHLFQITASKSQQRQKSVQKDTKDQFERTNKNEQRKNFLIQKLQVFGSTCNQNFQLLSKMKSKKQNVQIQVNIRNEYDHQLQIFLQNQQISKTQRQNSIKRLLPQFTNKNMKNKTKYNTRNNVFKKKSYSLVLKNNNELLESQLPSYNFISKKSQKSINQNMKNSTFLKISKQPLKFYQMTNKMHESSLISTKKLDLISNKSPQDKKNRKESLQNELSQQKLRIQKSEIKKIDIIKKIDTLRKQRQLKQLLKNDNFQKLPFIQKSVRK